jgi:hypothetical protein
MSYIQLVKNTDNHFIGTGTVTSVPEAVRNLFRENVA